MRKITWISVRDLEKIITGYCWRPDARRANMNLVVQCEGVRGVVIACTINDVDKPTFELEEVHGQTIRFAVKIITQKLKEQANDPRHQDNQPGQLSLFN